MQSLNMSSYLAIGGGSEVIVIDASIGDEVGEDGGNQNADTGKSW